MCNMLKFFLKTFRNQNEAQYEETKTDDQFFNIPPLSVKKNMFRILVISTVVKSFLSTWVKPFSLKQFTTS